MECFDYMENPSQSLPIAIRICLDAYAQVLQKEYAYEF